jgi:hypothetical protein
MHQRLSKQQRFSLDDKSNEIRTIVPDVADLLVDRPEPEHVLPSRFQ